MAKSHGKHAKGNAKASKKDNIVIEEERSPLSSEADKTVPFSADPITPKAKSPRDKALEREAVRVDAFDPDTSFDDEYMPAYDAYAPGVVLDGQPVKLKKKCNAKKIVGIVCACIAGALAVVYLGGVLFFSNWYYPGTSIGAIDASMKSSGDVKNELIKAVESYKVAITGDGFDYELDMSQVGVSVDADDIVKRMHEALPAWLWPVLLSQQSHQLADLFVADYSGSASLNNAIREKVEKFNETAVQPQDATIEYDAQKKQFVVRSEKSGTALDTDAVVKAVDTAILAFQDSVVLGDDELAKPKILSTDEKLKTAAETATRMSSITLNLNMAGQNAGSIGPDQISQWVKLGDDYTVSLDADAIDGYVSELEGSLETVGTERKYVRADGKQITVSGGVYGWEVDGDSLRDSINSAVTSGVSQDIDIPCISTGAEYNGAGKKDWGNRYVDIDLSEQHVRMYDDSGALVWESDCISGIPDGSHDTSVGVYWVNSKTSPSKLVGYEDGKKIYESTVRYWMPFDGNAIGLHDADWQPGFGGTMYRDGYGSHGCVNLPVDAAAQLYQIIKEGDCVVSHW